jgi:hypothetical protein
LYREHVTEPPEDSEYIAGESMSRNRLFAIAVVALTLGGLLVASSAFADRVAKKFKGDIILSRTPFPAEFKSDKAMIRYLKKVKEDEFIANKKGNWTVEYMAFFAKKLNAKQVVVIFFDISNETMEPVEVYSEGIRPGDPYTRIMAGYLTLSSEFFKPEHRYSMQIRKDRDGKPVATAEFVLRE